MIRFVGWLTHCKLSLFPVLSSLVSDRLYSTVKDEVCVAVAAS